VVTPIDPNAIATANAVVRRISMAELLPATPPSAKPGRRFLSQSRHEIVRRYWQAGGKGTEVMPDGPRRAGVVSIALFQVKAADEHDYQQWHLLHTTRMSLGLNPRNEPFDL
jgi:hypothetical protein